MALTLQAFRLATGAILAACALLILFSPAAARSLIGVTVVEHEQAPAEILRVRPGYPAATAGLRPGDLILEVGGSAPSGAEATALAIGAAGDAPMRLVVRRGDDVFEATVLPWPSPDPDRDAALFPYPADAEALATTTLRAVIADREYEIVSSEAVFTLQRSFGADARMIGRRVAFRARVMNCDVIGGAPPVLFQPSASPLNEFRPAQSLLFDLDFAYSQRAACDEYMAARGLDLSSPIVVVAGRFVMDDERLFSSGGPILLVDALLFDNSHVSLGAQVVGFVDVVERFVSLF